MSPIYMIPPNEQDWKDIRDGFYHKWDFPNCVGAIDGKHVEIMAPPNSGSLYYNYKGSFSIILLAVVDGDYRFRLIDVGGYGSNSDGGIFQHCTFGQRFLQDRLHFPADRPLPHHHIGVSVPHCIVGDAAFPSKINLLRPFPGGTDTALPHEKFIFNWRLSRARRVVENAFGILVARFRLYHRNLQLGPEVTEQIVLATCVLHNYLTTPQDIAAYEAKAPEFALPDDVEGVSDLPNMRGNHPTHQAKLVRQFITDYFMTSGKLSYQDTL